MDTDIVRYWNSALEPKFKKYRHILQGDFLRYSKAVLPELPIKQWMRVIDVGGIWGDICIEIKEYFKLEEKLLTNLNVNLIWISNS